MLLESNQQVDLRSLSAIKPWIDYWRVEMLGEIDLRWQETLKDLPGKVLPLVQKTRSSAKNELLKESRGCADYLLCIEPEDVVSCSEGKKKPDLQGKSYRARVFEEGVETDQVVLIASSSECMWQGVVQERLAPLEGELLSSLKIERPKKIERQEHLRRIALLEEALRRDPKDAYHVLLLASAYAETGRAGDALPYFQARIAMGGNQQEVAYCLYYAAQMKNQLRYPMDEIVKGYLDAYHAMSSRIEPLYALAHYFSEDENCVLSYVLLEEALTVSYPKECFRVMPDVYRYGVLYDFAKSAYAIKRVKESYQAMKRLLEEPYLPVQLRSQLKDNLKLAVFAPFS